MKLRRSDVRDWYVRRWYCIVAAVEVAGSGYCFVSVNRLIRGI